MAAAPRRGKAEPTAEFNLAARQTAEEGLSRDEQIQRDMAEWRRKHPDNDFRREL